MATASSLMTVEQLDAFPENGTDRWLIAGELRERSASSPGRQARTMRDRFHSRVTTRVAKFLENWLDQQTAPRGQVLAGGVGVILSHDPDTSFGIDVTYVSAEVMGRQSDDSTMIDGIPTLAVEILSPSDTVEDINEKITAYLAARVPHIWIIDPYWKTVTVHRPDASPAMLSVRDEITAEPQLPGFRASIKDFFE